MDMLRPDYDKLVSIASKAFKPPFFFQEAHTDKNYFNGHSQLRYVWSTAVRRVDINAPFHQGIFIDIFVMDSVPACDRKKEELIKETRNIFAYLRNKYKYNCQYSDHRLPHFNLPTRNRLIHKHTRIVHNVTYKRKNVHNYAG